MPPSFFPSLSVLLLFKLYSLKFPRGDVPPDLLSVASTFENYTSVSPNHEYYPEAHSRPVEMFARMSAGRIRSNILNTTLRMSTVVEEGTLRGNFFKHAQNIVICRLAVATAGNHIITRCRPNET